MAIETIAPSSEVKIEAHAQVSDTHPLRVRSLSTPA